MNFASLAHGASIEAMGLQPDEGLWLAVILIALSLIIALLLVKSVRDRKVLDLPPIVGASHVLMAVSFICLLAALLILFY